MDIPKKRGRGRPKNTPVDVVSGWAKQKIAESEVDKKRQIDKLMKIMEFKIMENSLNNTQPPIEKEKEEEGDYLHIKAKLGTNNYDIKVKTLEDQRMAVNLINQFGFIIIRKSH